MDSKDLKINVAKLMKTCFSQEEVSLQIRLALGEEGIYETPEGREFMIRLLLESAPDGVRVRGTIKGEIQMECDRCLEPYDQRVDLSVDDFFCQPSLPLMMEGGEIEEQVEISGEDSYLLEGDHIDLNNLLNDYLILALPIKHLCDSECKGICSRCGTNLNFSSCDCRDDYIDARLEKLKQWLDQEGG